MLERDWDRDFDLTAWRALSRQQRQARLEQAWRREDEREARGGAGWELPITAWQRYERGQTVWDIGLDPQPFDLTLAQAVGEVKPELFDGVVFGSTAVRDRVLSALLANAGLRRAVRLAPPLVCAEPDACHRHHQRELALHQLRRRQVHAEEEPRHAPVSQHLYDRLRVRPGREGQPG